MSTETILFKLRDAARTCPDADYALQLRHIADSLDAALSELIRYPDETRMQLVNALWVQAYWLVDKVPQPEPPGGTGLREGARLAA